MIISGIHLEGDATRVAAEGQAALAIGDTDRARERFGEAGAILEAKIGSRRKQADKHLIRFLAASQYYQGGHYQKALELTRKIEAKFLPPESRALYPTFLKDVKDRSAADYQASMRKQLLAHSNRKDYPALLEVFQQHPYVLPSASMAYLRADCCEHLKDYHAAALFFSDALERTPDDPNLLLSSTALSLTLAVSGDLTEASSYVEDQLQALPNAVTFITASLVRFHQAASSRVKEEQQQFLRDLVRYFEEAWQHYQKLSSRIRNHQDIKDHMLLGFETAALGLNRWGDPAEALRICNLAISFAPQSYGPRTLRGILTYPSEQAVEDFEQAIRMGDKHYYPYYLLAHARLVATDYKGAVSWARQAIEHRPSRRIEAQLYVWLAIAEHHLGHDRTALLSLLRRAEELDPDNEEIQHNVRLLESRTEARAPSFSDEWRDVQVELNGDEVTGERESRIVARSENRVTRELACASH